MSKVDLKGFEHLLVLDWKDEARAASLDTLFARSHAETQRAISWYFPRRSWRKRGAKLARSGAILFVTLAGLQPLVASMRRENTLLEWMPDQPVWASLFLALAVALLGFDRYSGLSKGWIRYVTTGLRLKQMLNAFVFASEQDRASWSRTAPTDDQLRASLTRCATFIEQVDEVVREETKSWSEDFIDALQQLGSAVEAGQEASAEGAVQLVITNGDKTDGPWSISVDGSTRSLRKTGVTAALSGLTPRTHSIVVEGEIQQRPVRGEQIVLVGSGTVVPVTIELR